MSKRRLTRQQTRRVQDRQQTLWENQQGSPLQPGQVRTRFGRHADVTLESGGTVHCHLRSNLDDIVCGDQVLVQSLEDETGIIATRNPRRTELARPGPRGEQRVVAANLDLLIVVSAPQPPADPRLVDQYIVSAEHAGIAPVVVLNKADLECPETSNLRNILAGYRELEYPVLECSAITGAGLKDLLIELGDSTCVLVGQSGVGKSSLVRALLPNEEIEVGALSEGSGLGTHTTTATRSYRLSGGGLLIDSPGIREFPLLPMSTAELAACFREFHPLLDQCRFRDCRHRDDPGCALQAALENGRIDPRRMQSFLEFDAAMQSARSH